MAMASSAKQTCLFFLLITLSSSLHIHARDSQFFNKIPSTTTATTANNAAPDNKELPSDNTKQQQEDPTFLPDNENGYGLYGHESGQLPPSATTTNADVDSSSFSSATTTVPYSTESKRPLSKYLPKNYNPTAYVTQPEDFSDSAGNSFTEAESFSTTTNPYTANTNGGENYYNNKQEEEESADQYRSYPTTTNNNNNYYTGGGSSFNSQPQGLSDTRFSGGATLSNRERNFNYGEANTFQPQGMSDTRTLENGKYHYDVYAEKYSSNHPYESLRGNNGRPRNYYGNNENTYEFNNGNSMGGYQNQNEFQDEENYNLP